MIQSWEAQDGIPDFPVDEGKDKDDDDDDYNEQEQDDNMVIKPEAEDAGQISPSHWRSSVGAKPGRGPPSFFAKKGLTPMHSMS
jgi:hypothetical protein